MCGKILIHCVSFGILWVMLKLEETIVGKRIYSVKAIKTHYTSSFKWTHLLRNSHFFHLFFFFDSFFFLCYFKKSRYFICFKSIHLHIKFKPNNVHISLNKLIQSNEWLSMQKHLGRGRIFKQIYYHFPALNFFQHFFFVPKNKTSFIL